MINNKPIHSPGRCSGYTVFTQPSVQLPNPTRRDRSLNQPHLGQIPGTILRSNDKARAARCHCISQAEAWGRQGYRWQAHVHLVASWWRWIQQWPRAYGAGLPLGTEGFGWNLFGGTAVQHRGHGKSSESHAAEAGQSGLLIISIRGSFCFCFCACFVFLILLLSLSLAWWLFPKNTLADEDLILLSTARESGLNYHGDELCLTSFREVFFLNVGGLLTTITHIHHVYDK